MLGHSAIGAEAVRALPAAIPIHHLAEVGVREGAGVAIQSQVFGSLRVPCNVGHMHRNHGHDRDKGSHTILMAMLPPGNLRELGLE